MDSGFVMSVVGRLTRHWMLHQHRGVGLCGLAEGPGEEHTDDDPVEQLEHRLVVELHRMESDLGWT